MSTLSTERVQFEAALLAILGGMDTGAGSGAGMGTTVPTRATAIEYVKAKLDELIPTGEGVSFALSSSPNVTDPLDLLINAHLDECTKDVILSAPLSVLLPTASSITTGTAYTDATTGYIPLPANFLRLSVLKMADWLRQIEVAITVNDPKYKKQSTVLRGGISKPVAVLTWKNISGAPTRILEYYSILASHSIDKLLYIPETTAENFITANPNLLDSLAWMCASKIMLITGMLNESKLAQERVIQSYYNL